MQEILQNLLNGIAVGAIYALIALGYTMVYGILKLINFAHGDVFMLGSFVGFYAGGYAARHLHDERRPARLGLRRAGHAARDGGLRPLRLPQRARSPTGRCATRRASPR